MSTISDKPRPPRPRLVKSASKPTQASSPASRPEYIPQGAFLVAGTSVALLFLGWLAFYFLLFLPRGSVG
jgi:hypothetical protein